MLNKHDDYSTAIKQKMREATVTKGKRYNSVLDLPAQKCYSAKFLFSEGHIGPWTNFVAVECFSQISEMITKELGKISLKKVDVYNGMLHDCPHIGPYDLVNADTCNSLSQNLLDFISLIDFLPEGELNLWLTPFRNNGQFKNDLIESLLPTDIWTKLELSGAIRGNIPIEVGASLCAIYSALNRFDCIVHTPIKYCQHVLPMWIYRFTNLHTPKSPRASLANFMISSNYESVHYDNKKSLVIPECDSLSQLVSYAVGQEKMGVKSYVMKRLRNEMRERKISGAEVKWVKAGWKAAISRTNIEPSMLRMAHAMIDAA